MNNSGPKPNGTSEGSSGTSYREFLPDLTSKKYRDLVSRTAVEHGERIFEDIPAVAETFAKWKAMQAEPFKGMTTNGISTRVMVG